MAITFYPLAPFNGKINFYEVTKTSNFSMPFFSGVARKKFWGGGMGVGGPENFFLKLYEIFLMGN